MVRLEASSSINDVSPPSLGHFVSKLYRSSRRMAGAGLSRCAAATFVPISSIVLRIEGRAACSRCSSRLRALSVRIFIPTDRERSVLNGAVSVRARTRFSGEIPPRGTPWPPTGSSKAPYRHRRWIYPVPGSRPPARDGYASRVVAVMPSRWATAMSFFMLSVMVWPHTTSTWERRRRSRPMSMPSLCSSGTASSKISGRYSGGADGREARLVHGASVPRSRCLRRLFRGTATARRRPRRGFFCPASSSALVFSHSCRLSGLDSAPGLGKSAPSGTFPLWRIPPPVPRHPAPPRCAVLQGH